MCIAMPKSYSPKPQRGDMCLSILSRYESRPTTIRLFLFNISAPRRAIMKVLKFGT